MGYGHARSHACLLARNAESPPRFFLRRAPKSVWLYINQPVLLGALPGVGWTRLLSSIIATCNAKVGHAAAVFLSVV